MKGRWTYRVRPSLLQGIAAGVEAAHKAGIFHRDLKPENILLPESGIGPKVVDFGVAKMTDAAAPPGTTTLTAGGTIVGTPAYMAPEQLRGGMVDGRADVFSLGVMTYEMLTGRLPFGGGSLIDIAMKQSEGNANLDTAGLSSSDRRRVEVRDGARSRGTASSRRWRWPTSSRERQRIPDYFFVFPCRSADVRSRREPAGFDRGGSCAS